MTYAEHAAHAVMRTAVENAYSAAEALERKYPEYFITVEVGEFDDSKPTAATVRFRFIATKGDKPTPEPLTLPLSMTAVGLARLLNEQVVQFQPTV